MINIPIYIVLCDHYHKSCWPQEPDNLESLAECQLQNSGAKLVYNPLSRRTESSATQPLEVWQTRSLPLSPKLQDKQISLFHRKMKGGFVYSLWVLWGGIAGLELSLPWLQSHGTQQHKPCRPTELSDKGHPLGSSHKNGVTSHVYKLLSGRYFTLECSGGKVQRWCPPSEVSGENYTGPLEECLFRDLPFIL